MVYLRLQWNPFFQAKMGHYQDINFDMLSIPYAWENFCCFKCQKHISYLVLIK